MYVNIKANAIRQEDEGVTVPTPLFFLLLGVGIGIFAGPPLMALSEAGRDSLTRMAREAATR